MPEHHRLTDPSPPRAPHDPERPSESARAPARRAGAPGAAVRDAHREPSRIAARILELWFGPP